MQIVNGKETEVVSALKDFGLSMYEARMYFTLLTIGEAKVMEITRRASVPQSKAYGVLENLTAKGFVEMSGERPKIYRAMVLEEITDIIKRAKQKEIQELEERRRELYQILQGIAPLHMKHSELRLFSPSYRRNNIKGGDKNGEKRICEGL